MQRPARDLYHRGVAQGGWIFPPARHGDRRRQRAGQILHSPGRGRERGLALAMRFSTRAFLWSFGPFVLLMLGSFWNIQKLVQLSVRDGIRTSLRHTHESIAYVRSKSELQNSRFLRMVGENASLKAGLQLLNTEASNPEARRTVEDQLREISQTLGVDFLLV